MARTKPKSTSPGDSVAQPAPPTPLPPITAADQAPSYRLWIELATRTTTRSLHHASGNEEATARSVANLFSIGRDQLAAHQDAAAFARALLRMLNDVIRPYTARWHGWMAGDKFPDETIREKFRTELLELQTRLDPFTVLFAALAKGVSPDQPTVEACFADKTLPLPSLGGAIESHIGGQIAFAAGTLPVELRPALPPGASISLATPADLNRAERQSILARRKALDRMHPGDRDPGEGDKGRLLNATGLCLSGGGIRSATFCLGIVQVLARKGFLQQFDYLSTVSGGGYFGAFLSSFLGLAPGRVATATAAENIGAVASNPDTAPSASPGDSALKAAIDARIAGAFGRETAAGVPEPEPKEESESAAVRHLRNNSRYLLDGGLWGKLMIAGLLITGIVCNLLLILPAPLAAVIATTDLRAAGFWGGAWDPSATSLPSDSAAAVLLDLWAVALAAFWLVMPLIQNLTRAKPPLSAGARLRAFWESATILLGVATAVFGLLYLVPWFFREYMEFRAWIYQRSHWRHLEKTLAGASAVAPVLLGVLSARLQSGGWLKRVATVLFALSGPFFYLFIYFFVGSRTKAPEPTLFFWAVALGLAALILGIVVLLPAIEARLLHGWRRSLLASLFTLNLPLLCLLVLLLFSGALIPGDDPDAPFWWLNLIAAAAISWGWLFVDLDMLSPHRYYRARLCDCYLASKGSPQTGLLRQFAQRFLHGRTATDADASPGKTTLADSHAIHSLQRVPLTTLGSSLATPYHLINTTANLPASTEPNLRGRNADFFVFSRHYCGSPICGYVPTEIIEQLDPHFDLGTAMAVSGAAASTNMGVLTMRQYRFLMTLLNVRLGYWLRRPMAGKSAWWCAPGPAYLLREMMGWMHERLPYLNLSDGGHIENLAAYELLRRRCKYLVIVDAGMEPGMQCADLLLLQRYAEIDLGIQMEFDITGFALNDRRVSQTYAILGKIHYPAAEPDSAPETGWFVYLKLACLGTEPGYVLDYRRVHPDFPHQSTAPSNRLRKDFP